MLRNNLLAAMSVAFISTAHPGCGFAATQQAPQAAPTRRNLQARRVRTTGRSARSTSATVQARARTRRATAERSVVPRRVIATWRI